MVKSQAKKNMFLSQANSLDTNYSECLRKADSYRVNKDYLNAEKFYKKALSYKPDDLMIMVSLGLLIYTYGDLDRDEEASSYLLKVRELEPNLPEINLALANICKRSQQYIHAIKFFNSEIAIRKKLKQDIPRELYEYLGSCHNEIGQTDEAIKIVYPLINKYPLLLSNYQDLLLLMAHSDKFDDKATNDFAKLAYSQCLAKSHLMTFKEEIAKIVASNDYLSSTKIKLGIISSKIHSAYAERFLADMIDRFDRDKISIFTYYCGEKDDELTERFRTLSDKFVKLNYHDFIHNAAAIAADGVHILIDTLGQLSGNSLPVLALKPAPIQASSIGYWGSTGVPEVDYVITQADALTESEQASYNEEIIPLSYVYYNISREDIAIEDSPITKNGYITFGCQNRRQKYNSDVLNLWASILSDLPESRLLLTTNLGEEKAYTDYVHSFFTRQGVDPNRVVIEYKASTDEYFHNYNRIDIVLDPYPFTGGCSSVDAIYMGKPIVTLRGKKLVGRITAEHLKHVEAEELIVENKEDYKVKAIELAKDFNKIKEYNRILRQKLLESIIIDPEFCSKEYQNAIEHMYKVKFATLPWERN